MTTPAHGPADAADPLDAPTAALAAAVLEVARHVEDGPLGRPRWFALAREAELVAGSPALASLLGSGPDRDDLSLTPVELDESTGAPGPDGPADPLEALAGIAWPELATGGALAADLAPRAWELRDGVADGAPEGTLRVVVAALADGTTWCAVRRPGEDGYVLGAGLVPSLTAALQETVAGL